jgi:chromosome segregation ATPase
MVWNRRLGELKSRLEGLEGRLLKCSEEAIGAKVKAEFLEDLLKNLYIHIHRLEERMDSLSYRAGDLASEIRYLERRLNEVVERLEKLEKGLRGEVQ